MIHNTRPTVFIYISFSTRQKIHSRLAIHISSLQGAAPGRSSGWAAYSPAGWCCRGSHTAPTSGARGLQAPPSRSPSRVLSLGGRLLRLEWRMTEVGQSVLAVGRQVSGCYEVIVTPAGSLGTGYSLEVSNNNTGKLQSLTLSDVAFGDVWVCSGQSNMVFVLKVRAARGQREHLSL